MPAGDLVDGEEDLFQVLHLYLTLEKDLPGSIYGVFVCLDHSRVAHCCL